MHYHLEIIMPPVVDVNAAIEQILEPFSENNEESRGSFWDWWQIGGRYSGSKIESAINEEQLIAFRKELNNRNVTVSGLIWGKQEISPPEQIPMVDALWREMCPGGGDACPLFKHSGERMQKDICTLAECPSGLTAFRVIVAGPSFDGKTEAVYMVAQDIWNGVTYQDTDFGGNVISAIDKWRENSANYKEEYAKKVTPKPDWLVVTVDYHT